MNEPRAFWNNFDSSLTFKDMTSKHYFEGHFQANNLIHILVFKTKEQ